MNKSKRYEWLKSHQEKLEEHKKIIDEKYPADQKGSVIFGKAKKPDSTQRHFNRIARKAVLREALILVFLDILSSLYDDNRSTILDSFFKSWIGILDEFGCPKMPSDDDVIKEFAETENLDEYIEKFLSIKEPAK